MRIRERRHGAVIVLVGALAMLSGALGLFSAPAGAERSAALSAFGGAVRERSVRPPIAKPCGSIHVHGRRLRVDITEVIGVPARGCRAARTVMRRFVSRSPGFMENGQVVYRGRAYGCYRSRLDGEGWDYHCNTSDFGGSHDMLIDFGAGRRF
jgi:hypothetical protein